MKIALLMEMERLDPARGGAERYSWDYSAALARAGNEVHVFARPGGSVAPGVTLREVRSGGLGRAGRMKAFAGHVERMLAHEQFDAVHGIGWTWSQDVFQPHGGVFLANCEARGKTSFWSRLSPRRRACRLIETRQYGDRSARIYVAISDKVRRDMRRFYDVPPERIRTVYNGVDTERFSPRNRDTFRDKTREAWGIGGDEVVFLIVAHNFALKGVPELAECVTAKGFPSCRVLVVGRGDKRRIAQQAESRAPGRVIFAGAVADAAPFYAAADAYVHPTHYDPCSLTVLEALAAGLPAVTTTANGAGELLVGGRAGTVVPPGDLAALDAALRPLFDAHRRADMGAAARALAEEHTLAHNVTEMSDVYREIIALKGGA